ncbi:MerR family transcriptional regulator [Desulfocurvibacter africanus]|uniref:MerR family transcriptional regulator n=1 Tax=Desulfocurvibacter africanus TaxID=873 RepID=UPI00041CED5D|nr:MerR family transcriptional regulator [Desulfocurvibacter africanus]
MDAQDFPAGKPPDSARLYKIGQAADLLGVKPFVLRFWESEFPQLQPVRTASGQRMYTHEHIELVRRIQHLLYEQGLTIEGARKALEENGRRGLLKKIEAELLQIKRLLER